MKYIKTFEKFTINEASFRDNLYNASTIITGKPRTWEINQERAEKFTRSVAEILISRGYKLREEGGTMTDSKDIWALTDEGMQPIVFLAKYDDYDKNKLEISVSFYFPSDNMEKNEIIPIDENDLERTADKVAEVLEKFRSLGHRGNSFSKQGNWRIGLGEEQR